MKGFMCTPNPVTISIALFYSMLQMSSVYAASADQAVDLGNDTIKNKVVEVSKQKIFNSSAGCMACHQAEEIPSNINTDSK